MADAAEDHSDSHPFALVDNQATGDLPSVDAVKTVLAYHQRTMHHLHRYARSPGYLDWANQPDPFRTFEGSPRVQLPLGADRLATSYAELFVPGAVAAQPLSLESIGVLFELALGLSAWKQYQGNRWALRCNPSSGNLHPTEAYAIIPELGTLGAGVYHYVSRNHCLEHHCAFAPTLAARLVEVLPPSALLVGLTSIHWREAWKYGERAFRYCQHDVGHALAAVRFAAAALGWSAILVDSLGDTDLAALLGIDRAEDFAGLDPADREHPDALLLIAPVQPLPLPTDRLPIQAIREQHWTGRANPLSPSHVRWQVIEEVAQACWKPASDPAVSVDAVGLPPLASSCRAPAATLIRQRRSCLALDGRTSLPADAFYGMLDHLLPRPGVAPWDVWPWPAHLHAGIFVHRVRGLAPGLYLLERNVRDHERLRSALRDTFIWKRPPDCPAYLRLYCLAEVDLRQAARVTSCHQEIAADGAFSLGMIADFGDSIRTWGAWWYRRLFWEAGILGQVLYLEAQAAGIRSTGIGCYFDDTFHDLLGLIGDAFRDLYHFTVGTPVDDPRLLTLPAYAHLQQA